MYAEIAFVRLAIGKFEPFQEIQEGNDRHCVGCTSISDSPQSYIDGDKRFHLRDIILLDIARE